MLRLIHIGKRRGCKLFVMIYRFLDNPNYPKNTKERIFLPESFTPKQPLVSKYGTNSFGQKNYNILNNSVNYYGKCFNY